MLKALLAAWLTIGVLDALWLGWLAKGFYRQELGELMRSDIRLVPALLFYLLYPVGLVGLALQPLPAGWPEALWRCAALGALAYGTYDLTNLATLQGFSTRMAIVDMAWGTLLSLAGGAAAYAVLRAGAAGPAAG